MGKLKPLLPSLREKKRYLAYEVIANHRFNDAIEVNKAIIDSVKEFVGSQGVAKAGIVPVDDVWNAKQQRGIVRVNNKHTDTVRSSFVFLTKVQEKEVIVRSLGASGTLKRTQQKYLN